MNHPYFFKNPNEIEHLTLKYFSFLSIHVENHVLAYYSMK